MLMRPSNSTTSILAERSLGRIIVFDDSSPANRDKYFLLLEQARTHNELCYVGPTKTSSFCRISMRGSAIPASRAW